jgi:hypothetical protein
MQERVYNGYQIAQHRKNLIASEIIVGIPPFTVQHYVCAMQIIGISYEFHSFIIIIIR